MKKSNVERSDERNKNEPMRPIRELHQPIMTGMPIMPNQPMKPMPRNWYPPGTAFNPIGVPPWAYQPAIPAPSPCQPVMPNMPNSPINQPEVEIPIQPGPPVLKDTKYLQGYLRENIGRYVRIDFLIGTNTLIDKAGELIDVGIDYVILREAETDDYDIGDLYSIKFVKIFF